MASELTLNELVRQFRGFLSAGDVDPERSREVIADIDRTIAALQAVRTAAIAAGWTTEIVGHG